MRDKIPEIMNQCDIGDASYYGAQSSALQVMNLLGSLYFSKNLSPEKIILLIACFTLNFRRENGINRLRAATSSEIHDCVSKFGIDVHGTTMDLVEQGHLIEAGRGYIVSFPELIKNLAYFSTSENTTSVQPSRIMQ
ncbi:MAG: hypothetical protein EKK40_18235 [Bradyrhizobiaceae bacterium]|nr:MAG: hypothetical protein EKK40_18235 [Bradyrhizobiaceae bacterium]